MLVLSRKPFEGIVVEHPRGDVHVVVVEIGNNFVRLGIEADRSIVVNRDEVAEAIALAAENGCLNEMEQVLDARETDHDGI